MFDRTLYALLYAPRIEVEVLMLTEATRVTLRGVGVFATTDSFWRRVGGNNPFFLLDSSSQQPTELELLQLGELSKQYRETRFEPLEIHDEFWGSYANTITLYKEDGVWRYRRMTWYITVSWVPYQGVALEDLFGSYIMWDEDKAL